MSGSGGVERGGDYRGPDTEEDDATATTAEGNERTVRRIPKEVVAQRNLDAIDEMFAEDAVDHSPIGDFDGREGSRRGFEALLDGFPDFTSTVDDVVAEGDTVALRLTERGTHDGEFVGIDPTGRTVEFRAMVFFRPEDGKVAERWTQLDRLGLLGQLGVVEPPAE